MSFVSVDDIATSIGRPISERDEMAQVELWIADVEMILSARLGDLALLNEPLVAYVERTAVVEAMRLRAESPDAPVSMSKAILEAVDPWWSVLASAGAAGETSTAWSFSLLGA